MEGDADGGESAVGGDVGEGEQEAGSGTDDAADNAVSSEVEEV